MALSNKTTLRSIYPVSDIKRIYDCSIKDG